MKAENIKTVAVIGAGAMGQQIAMNTALNGREKGYKVIPLRQLPGSNRESNKMDSRLSCRTCRKRTSYPGRGRQGSCKSCY